MKASAEFEGMVRAAIVGIDTEQVREEYRQGRFARADKVKDLDRRYRWDLFWAAGGTRLLAQADQEGLYDSHIDTVLRKVVRPLNEGE